MGTTVDKLNKLAQTKAAIKAAIEAKGVTVGDAVFGDYPTKISAISGGGSSGVIEDYLNEQGLGYLINDILRGVQRSVSIHDTTKNLYQLLGDNNNGGIMYANGCLPPNDNQAINYQKSLFSVRNVDFSNWTYTQSSGRAFAFNNNLSDFSGVSTAASGDGITDFSKVTNAQMMFAASMLLDLKVYLPIVTNIDSLVSDCSYIKTCTIKTLGQTVSSTYTFNRCYELEEVTLINELKTTTLQGFTFSCNKLNKINGIINIEGVTNTNQFLDGNGAKNITEVWIKNLGTSINIVSPNITKECVLYMFNNAATVTGTHIISLNTTVYNSLTSDEIAIATGKGFTVRGGAN